MLLRAAENRNHYPRKGRCPLIEKKQENHMPTVIEIISDRKVEKP
jgi:hypothetical protein